MIVDPAIVPFPITSGKCFVFASNPNFAGVVFEMGQSGNPNLGVPAGYYPVIQLSNGSVQLFSAQDGPVIQVDYKAVQG